MTKFVEAIKELPWLITFIKTEFHSRCSRHDTRRCSVFCLECLGQPICDLCHKESCLHQHHCCLRSYRASNQSGMRVSSISRYLDLAGIQTYCINSSDIVYIQQKKVKGRSRPILVTNSCRSCGCELLSSTTSFCSIECKVKHEVGSNLDVYAASVFSVSTTTQEESEKAAASSSASTSSLQNPSSFRKRNRKGIPIRSPLF